MRRLILAALVLLLAIPVRLLAIDQPTEPADETPEPAASPATGRPASSHQSEGAEPDREAIETLEPAQDDEPDDEDLEDARQVAAAFAREYLTWTHDEPDAERVDRVAPHVDREFADAIADAQATGTAEQHAQGEWSQTVDVLDIRTQSVRRRAVEFTVMTELTIHDNDGQRTVPSNLGVIVRHQEGTWLITDLR